MWRSSRVLTDQYHLPAAPSGGRQDERSTNDAARMAGPGRICFLALATDLRGSTRITHFFAGVLEASVTSLFCRGFHRITAGFTASAQFICGFAVSSLMLGGGFRQSAFRNVVLDYGDHRLQH